MHLLDKGEGVQLVHELFLDRDFLEIGGLNYVVEIKVGKLFTGLALELGFFGKLAFALRGLVLQLEQWLDFEAILPFIVREQLADLRQLGRCFGRIKAGAGQPFGFVRGCGYSLNVKGQPVRTKPDV